MNNNEVKEIYISLNEYMNKLDNGLEKMIDLIRGERENEFLTMILDVIEGLDWSIKAISITNEYHGIDDLDSLNDVLSEVIEGLENKDYILVGDIFEYEILPKVRDWKEKLVS